MNVERFRAARTPRFRRGFTLIELLLVIAIIGVVTAISVPTFVKSIKGNRLRSAARSVVMAGRYAHSMCLLNQRELDLRFDLANSTVAVVPVGLPEPAGKDGPDDAPPPGAGGSVVMVERKLDEVRIAAVQIDDEDDAAPTGDEAMPVIRYRSNGSCTPYSVRLEDDEGDSVTIYVDMLGGAETERE